MNGFLKTFDKIISLRFRFTENSVLEKYDYI